MEKNEEMEELKQKAFVCAIVFLFVVIVGLIFIFNRFGSDVDAVTDALRNDEDFVVFFRSDDSSCSECSMVEERLNAYGVSYYNYDVRVGSFSSLLEKLKIDYEVLPPAIYVIQDGKVLYNITNSAEMTQSRLAKLIGVSTLLIGSLESDNTTQGVSTYNLYKISKVLDVPIEKFYGIPIMETIVDELEKNKIKSSFLDFILFFV